jgi:hypothetical protein
VFDREVVWNWGFGMGRAPGADAGLKSGASIGLGVSLESPPDPLDRLHVSLGLSIAVRVSAPLCFSG